MRGVFFKWHKEYRAYRRHIYVLYGYVKCTPVLFSTPLRPVPQLVLRGVVEVIFCAEWLSTSFADAVVAALTCLVLMEIFYRFHNGTLHARAMSFGPVTSMTSPTKFPHFFHVGFSHL